jgi:hypothetical protein
MNSYSYITNSSKGHHEKLGSHPKTPNLEGQLVISPKLARAAYAIRHAGYSSYGYITPRYDGLFFDKYDSKVNSRTVIVFKNGEAAATVRVCLYDPENHNSSPLPAMEIFGNEIMALLTSQGTLGKCARAVEITRMARSPTFANDIDIVFALFRLVGYLILYYGADIVFNAVRPHHMAMYRRFGFQKLEEPRQYPNLTYKAGLMACYKSNYDKAKNNLSFLKNLSMEDLTYNGLITGEKVSIYKNLHSPVSKLHQYSPNVAVSIAA